MSNKHQDPLISTDAIHQDFLDAKNRIYNPCGIKCSQPVMEKESTEYGACTFKLNDFFIISVRKDDCFGQFIFPKSVLREQDVLSISGKGGKRAIRVYPPWDKVLNRQAQKTQKWQLEYFLDASSNKEIDHVRVQMLYFGKKHILKKILKAYKIDKSQAFYIGDETRDVDAAKECDVSSIAVTWGFNSEKILSQYHPNYIARKPENILTICK